MQAEGVDHHARGPAAGDERPARGSSTQLADLVAQLVLAPLLLIGLVIVHVPDLRNPAFGLGLAMAVSALAIAPPLVLAAIEQLCRPAGPRKGGRVWLLHFNIMLVNYATAVPIGILGAWLAKRLVKSLGVNLGLIDLRFEGQYGFPGLLLAVALLLLISDFFFYWYHRLLHESEFLWQHHKLHHLDPEFDAMTGPRQNWLENFLSIFFIAIPMAVLFRLDSLDPFRLGLLDGAIIGFARSIVNISHANLRIQFGWASRLFISPQTHRIHHSLLPQHLNVNYAVFFPAWDILFGTYCHPQRDEFPPTGVRNETEISSVWEAQYFPIREWIKFARGEIAPREKPALAGSTDRKRDDARGTIGRGRR